MPHPPLLRRIHTTCRGVAAVAVLAFPLASHAGGHVDPDRLVICGKTFITVVLAPRDGGNPFDQRDAATFTVRKADIEAVMIARHRWSMSVKGHDDFVDLMVVDTVHGVFEKLVECLD